MFMASPPLVFIPAFIVCRPPDGANHFDMAGREEVGEGSRPDCRSKTSQMQFRRIETNTGRQAVIDAADRNET